MSKLVCEVCKGKSLVKQGDVFKCADCGAIYPLEDVKKLLTDTSAASNETVESPAKRKSGKKSLLKIIGLSIPLLLVLFIGISIFQAVDPKTNAKSVAKSQVANMWHQVDADLELVDIDYDFVDADGNIYTVNGNYHVTDGSVSDFRGTFSVVLKLESSPNNWRVIDLEVAVPEQLLPYVK